MEVAADEREGSQRGDGEDNKRGNAGPSHKGRKGTKAKHIMHDQPTENREDMKETPKEFVGEVDDNSDEVSSITASFLSTQSYK